MNPAQFQQVGEATCGAACVRMILDHFGHKVPSERTLAKELQAKFETGIEPWRIEMYLRAKGIEALYVQEEKGFATLKRRLDNGWIPIICWADWGGHYCIVTAIIEGLMWLADPAASYERRPDGYTTASVDRFKSLWFTPTTRHKREVIYVKDEMVAKT